ncbi:hypothetical protein OF83DRAFT_193095 [Amylostereum chailletii]|nr:hypothetical protein OF83DRAFT_193095 [Amylostereum chailletii]
MGGNDRKCSLCMKMSVRRCTGCDKAWYCSAQCQKKDWVQHIFDCNPKRPITTADRLVLSLSQGGMPTDIQTLLDYGFSHPSMATTPLKLVSVYGDVFYLLQFKAQAVHKAREAGVLAQEIQKAYERLPSNARGVHYSFFLQNKAVFEGLGGRNRAPKVSELFSTTLDGAKDSGVRLWEAMGGRPGMTPEQVRSEFQRLPVRHRVCTTLYGDILENRKPGTESLEWRAFGFSTCTSPREINGLMDLYSALLKQCTFDEFCTAYDDANLVTLFRDKRVWVFPPDHPILDVLNDPSKTKKSVWGLQEHVTRLLPCKPGVGMSKPHPTFEADYGFKNCKTVEGRDRLKKLYRAYFERPDQKPLLLHRAAMEGRLMEYLEEATQIELKPRLYAHLLRNRYTPRSK